MFKIVILTVGGFEIEGFFGDEGRDIFVLLFLGGFGRFAGHDGVLRSSKSDSTQSMFDNMKREQCSYAVRGGCLGGAEICWPFLGIA
jgi:hypothetical protein